LGIQSITEQSGEYIASAPYIGIIIGALAGGLCFVIFGLARSMYAGGFSMVVILSKLKGRPIEQSPFVRIIVAAGTILSIALGVAASMVLGGAVGGFIEYVLMKLT
jgi:hypothetical protein